MNLKHVSLHNAVAEPHPVYSGWLLARYPRAVRDLMNQGARRRGGDSTMAEVRFVTPSPLVGVTLSSLDEDSMVRIYRGAFAHSEHVLPAGRATTLTLDHPVLFESMDKSLLHAGGWSSDVWRIVFDRCRGGVHDVEVYGHGLRPPKASETPSTRWMAYGSSITHSTFFSHTGFAARELNADVANKGLSGACHVEPEAADYLASLDWDVATLELGVNLRGNPQAESFFERRVRYLLKALRKTHPEQPILLITVFTNRDNHPEVEPNEVTRMQSFFDDTLRKIQGDSGDANLHMIEGTDIVDDITILGCDLLHPSPHGCARMGANLARLMRPIL